MPAPARREGSSLVSRLNASVQLQQPNSLLRLDKYFRSADLLVRQADQYRRQRNEEQLYVMLMRLVSLVVETIPSHAGFDKADARYGALRRLCLSVAMPELERLKVGLHLKDRTERLAGDSEPLFSVRKEPGTVRMAWGNPDEVRWGEGSLGQAREESASLSTASSGPPPSPLVPLPDLSSLVSVKEASQAALERHAVLPADAYSATEPAAPRSSSPGLGWPATRLGLPSRSGQYPDLIAFEELPPPPAPVPRPPQQNASPPPPPPPPPPDPLGDRSLRLGPQEVEVSTRPPPATPLRPEDTCCLPPPVPASSTVQAPQQGSGVAEIKRRQSLRDVHVSVRLMDEFLRYATHNTRRGVETCGILAGRLTADDSTFTITTLIIPKQEGTSDTVQALNEEDIFEVQDSRGLYPLGWIHTHPTQTCFLSSVDVHTHCGYQTMLEEAVAVVMAPRDASKKVGIFRLSTPGGLALVQKCPQRGFHAHGPTATKQPLYEFCGHVYLNPRAEFEVLDLR